MATTFYYDEQQSILWIEDCGEKYPISLIGPKGEDGKDGKDGKDGLTPIFQIRDMHWYVSYDNGATWNVLGLATGAPGKDGKDGHTPVIGVGGEPQHDILYWTVDGEWLLDADGNRIPVTGRNGRDGQDGKDGKTPQLRMDGNDIWISYDNNQWTHLGAIECDCDCDCGEGDATNPNLLLATNLDNEVVAGLSCLNECVIGEETVQDPIFVWAGGTREEAVLNKPNVEISITKSGFNSKLGCMHIAEDHSINMTNTEETPIIYVDPNKSVWQATDRPADTREQINLITPESQIVDTELSTTYTFDISKIETLEERLWQIAPFDIKFDIGEGIALDNYPVAIKVVIEESSTKVQTILYESSPNSNFHGSFPIRTNRGSIFGSKLQLKVLVVAFKQTVSIDNTITVQLNDSFVDITSRDSLTTYNDNPYKIHIGQDGVLVESGEVGVTVWVEKSTTGTGRTKNIPHVRITGLSTEDDYSKLSLGELYCDSNGYLKIVQ